MRRSTPTGKTEKPVMRFFCTQCARCCRYEEGFVFLTRGDIGLLARSLEESEDEFIARYCRWVPMGFTMQLSLREQRNRDCVFWRDGGCSVYDARPSQCRTYPFWQHLVETWADWDREAETCPGIGVGPTVSDEEVSHALAVRRRELPVVKPRGEPPGVQK